MTDRPITLFALFALALPGCPSEDAEPDVAAVEGDIRASLEVQAAKSCECWEAQGDPSAEACIEESLKTDAVRQCELDVYAAYPSESVDYLECLRAAQETLTQCWVDNFDCNDPETQSQCGQQGDAVSECEASAVVGAELDKCLE